MLLVPRSTLRRTSPVRRPRCQRRDSPCRWAKSCTWTCRLVNCCTHTHRKVRRLLTKPVEPAGCHGNGQRGPGAIGARSQLRTPSWERGIWDGAPTLSPAQRPALVAAPKREQQRWGHKDVPGHPSPRTMCLALSLPSALSFPAFLTSTSALQELQPHVDANSPGQGVPGSALRQLVHCGDGGKGQGASPGAPWEPAPAPSAGP